MKNYTMIAALATSFLAIGAAQAQDTSGATCPDGTITCNIAAIGDKEINTDQTIGDTVDNTYAPDSANASASTGAIDVKNTAQGGTGGNANGNTSTNNNQSSANNTGRIDQAANTTGGNIASNANQSQGDLSQSIGDQSANTTGGSANTNSGNVSAAGGAGGAGGKAVSGNSVSKASGGQGGRSASMSQGGRSNSGGNTFRGGNTSVDASQRTTIKHAANTAAMIDSQGYGGQNCFGDTNPSGQFGASIQTFGWGVTANAMKASNVCGLARLGGNQLGLAYIAQMDPNARTAMLNNGMAITKAQVAKAEADALKAEADMRKAMAWSQCFMRPDGRPQVDAKWNRSIDEAVTDCLAYLGKPAALAMNATPSSKVPAPTCPAGSAWDGKGCWMPARR